MIFKAKKTTFGSIGFTLTVLKREENRQSLEMILNKYTQICTYRIFKYQIVRNQQKLLEFHRKIGMMA